MPSLSGEILFKPSTTANAENAKTDDVENNASKFDMPPSQFLQLLQSSAERKNCEYANSLYLFTNVVCHRVWLNGPFNVLVVAFLKKHVTGLMFGCTVPQFQLSQIILRVYLHQLWI